jgi:hypothetical protein
LDFPDAGIRYPHLQLEAAPPMKIEWNGQIGPAAILGIIGPIVTTVTVIWMASGVYTKIVDRIDAQGTKIEEVAKGSDQRFETVHNALARTQTEQSNSDQRMGRVETALVYVSQQVQRVEARLNGTSPTAPAITAPSLSPTKP